MDEDDDEVVLKYSARTSLLYSGKRYTCTLDTLKCTLDRYGIAILPSVLLEVEQADMNDGMWSAVEYYTSRLSKPVRRDKPSTYVSLFDLAPSHGGLIQHFGWGHQQYVWEVRQNSNVIAAFEKLWGTNNLRTSFDGVNCSLGALMTKPRGVFRDKGWLHTDQRWSNIEFECVQGFVTANEIAAGDGTLRFLEGSHNKRAQFVRAFPELALHNEDWYMLDNEELDWFGAIGCQERCVTCPAGSMVLWDSRLIHSGIEPWSTKQLEGALKRPVGPRLPRNVIYVCMMPDDAKKGHAKKRKAIFDDSNPNMRLRMTTHWPTRVRLFARTPRTFGNAPPVGCTQSDPTRYWSFVPDTPMPTLSENGRRIAGLL